MKTKKIVKLKFITLSAVLICLVVMYLIWVCISVVKMNDLEKIGYLSNEKGNDYKETYIEIDFLNKRIQEITNDRGKQYYEYITTISDKELSKIKAICIFSYFPMWREKYNDNSNDGAYWKSYVIYEDVVKKVTYGHYAYPFTYRFFSFEMTTHGLPPIGSTSFD